MQSIPLLSLTAIAVAAIPAHRFVGWNNQLAAAQAASRGVSRFDAAPDDALTVDVIGTSLVEAGEAIPVGAAIEVGANGVAMVKAAGITVARALEAAVVPGQVFEVLLIQQ